MPRNRPDVRWRDSRPHPADIGATVWTFFGNPFEGRGGDTQRDFGFRPDLDTKRVYPGEPGWTPVPNPPINLLVPPGPAPLNPITTPPFAGPIPTTPPPPPSPSPSPPTPAPAPAPPRVPGGGGGGSVADYPAPKRPPIQVPRGNPDAWSRLARVLGRLGRLNDPRIQAAWRVGSEIGRQIYERFDVEILDAIDRIVGREQRERASAPRVRNPLSEPARAPAPRARAAPRPRPAEPARAPAAEPAPLISREFFDELRDAFPTEPRTAPAPAPARARSPSPSSRTATSTAPAPVRSPFTFTLTWSDPFVPLPRRARVPSRRIVRMPFVPSSPSPFVPSSPSPFVPSSPSPFVPGSPLAPLTPSPEPALGFQPGTAQPPGRTQACRGSVPKRKRGQCRQGYFDERPDGTTKFITWSTRRCPSSRKKFR